MKDHPVVVFELDGVNPDRRFPNIKMQHGFRAEVGSWEKEDEQTNMEILADKDVPNAYYDPKDDFGVSSRKMFPDGIFLDMPVPENDLDLAISLAAMRATSEFHEIMEFIKVDGRRIANPHPETRDGDMWKWLSAKMRDLYLEYIERYPCDD